VVAELCDRAVEDVAGETKEKKRNQEKRIFGLVLILKIKWGTLSIFNPFALRPAVVRLDII
jgi:hypothetical protein